MAYRELKVTHGGGLGARWIAVAIILVSFTALSGLWKRVDCSLGIEKACQRIEQIYIDQEIQEKEILNK